MKETLKYDKMLTTIYDNSALAKELYDDFKRRLKGAKEG